jgi:hypothetical protein
MSATLEKLQSRINAKLLKVQEEQRQVPEFEPVQEVAADTFTPETLLEGIRQEYLTINEGLTAYPEPVLNEAALLAMADGKLDTPGKLYVHYRLRHLIDSRAPQDKPKVKAHIPGKTLGRAKV